MANNAINAESPATTEFYINITYGDLVIADVRHQQAGGNLLPVTVRDTLVDYIAQSFRNVTLGDSLDIYRAAELDSYFATYVDENSYRKMTVERIDWRRVPRSDLSKCHSAIFHLEPIGFRFYLPAMMTSLLDCDQNSEKTLFDPLVFRLQRIAEDCRYRDVHICDLFNRSQRAAIRRFLKYLLHNCRRTMDYDDLHQTLLLFEKCGTSSCD